MNERWLLEVLSTLWERSQSIIENCLYPRLATWKSNSQILCDYIAELFVNHKILLWIIITMCILSLVTIQLHNRCAILSSIPLWHFYKNVKCKLIESSRLEELGLGLETWTWNKEIPHLHWVFTDRKANIYTFILQIYNLFCMYRLYWCQPRNYRLFLCHPDSFCYRNW